MDFFIWPFISQLSTTLSFGLQHKLPNKTHWRLRKDSRVENMTGRQKTSCRGFSAHATCSHASHLHWVVRTHMHKYKPSEINSESSAIRQKPHLHSETAEGWKQICFLYYLPSLKATLSRLHIIAINNVNLTSCFPQTASILVICLSSRCFLLLGVSCSTELTNSVTLPPIFLCNSHHPFTFIHCSSFFLLLSSILKHKNTLCLSLNETPPFNTAPPPSVYLLVWDSDAAPHPVFHVLLWWSDPGATRLAEHLPAELHRYQSASASPEHHCRSLLVHSSMSVCMRVCITACDACGLPVTYILQSLLHNAPSNQLNVPEAGIKKKTGDTLCSLRSSWALNHSTGERTKALLQREKKSQWGERKGWEGAWNVPVSLKDRRQWKAASAAGVRMYPLFETE